MGGLLHELDDLSSHALFVAQVSQFFQPSQLSIVYLTGTGFNTCSVRRMRGAVSCIVMGDIVKRAWMDVPIWGRDARSADVKVSNESKEVGTDSSELTPIAVGDF